MPDVACASSNHPFSASAFADTRARETDANCNGSAAVQVQARNEDARVDNCRRIPFVQVVRGVLSGWMPRET